MTIPNDFEFSPPGEQDEKKLFRNLNEMYQQISSGVNGSTRASYFPAPQTFTPTLDGSTTSGTFTYSAQNAFVQRVGRFCDYWFEITWTASGSAAGSLIVKLPYQSGLFVGNPFVGTCFPNNINIGANIGMYIEVQKSSFNALVKEYPASGSASEKSVTATGSLKGYLRYLITEDGGSI